MQTDQFHALRLFPGEDLRLAIQRFVNEKKIEAGWIVTCVGSLTQWNIRFANAKDGASGSGHFEILSLSGTVSENGSHLHITIADNTGNTTGGHLLDGCIVYTTAEIIIGESTKYIFTREKDGSTEWDELQIRIKHPNLH